MIKKVRVGLGMSLMGLGMFAECEWFLLQMICLIAGYILMKDLTIEEETYD